MAGLQPPVVMMLDQMVIGIAWKGQWVQPERIDRPGREPGKAGPNGREMRKIEADDIVAEQEIGLGGKRFQPVEGGLPVAVAEDDLLPVPAADGGKGENLRLTRVNFQIDRQATVNKRKVDMTVLGSIHVVGLVLAIGMLVL